MNYNTATHLLRSSLFRVVFFIAGVIGIFTGLSEVLPQRSTYAVEQAQVATSFSSNIEVNPENTAHFTIAISFQNVGEDPTILTGYDLVIGDVLPLAVEAKSGVTLLETSVLERAGTVIQIDLADTVLRADTAIDVSVTYSVDDFMAIRGGTYDAELPIFQQTDTSQGESVTFSYPQSFGEVNYSTAQFERRSDNGYTILAFNDLSTVTRLFVSVGNTKYYSVAFERGLVNDAEGYVKQEILIPPEYSSQRFAVTSISPSPDSSRYLPDGNYLLTYSVRGNDTLYVRVQGVIAVDLPAEQNTTATPLTQEEKDTYLDTESAWWNITDTSLLADISVVSELETLDEKIDRLYQYTKDELILSEGFRELHGTEFRKGAEIALKTYKNASVEDYADVFVALARYAGIPARVVAGYVYPYSIEETSLGMFHVWPQYWADDTGWISVDPAYEMYAGLPCLEYVGLNRVVVVSMYDAEIYGTFQETSTEYALTDEVVELESQLTAEIEFPSNIKAGTPAEGFLTIRNEGNSIIKNLNYTSVSEDDTDITMGEAFLHESIVPGQVLQVSFTVEPYEWYANGSRSVTFSVEGEAEETVQRADVSQNFEVNPLWWVEPVTWLITIMAFAVFLWSVWSGAKLGAWVLRLFRKQHPPEPINVGGKVIS